MIKPIIDINHEDGIIQFIIEIEQHTNGDINFNVEKYSESIKKLVKSILGTQEDIKDFLMSLGDHSIAVWEEVLPKKLMEKFRKKGVFNGISIQKKAAYKHQILSYASVDSDDKPITRCLDKYKHTLEKISEIMDSLKKEASSNINH